jgi:hypothetical protein
LKWVLSTRWSIKASSSAKQAMMPSGTQTVGVLSFSSIHTTSSLSILCRTEFSDLDPPDRRFKDATGRVVYVGTSSTEDTILWVWREVLLSSIVHNPSDAVAKKIVTDMKKLKLTEEMLERLDDEILRA